MMSNIIVKIPDGTINIALKEFIAERTLKLLAIKILFITPIVAVLNDHVQSDMNFWTAKPGIVSKYRTIR